nr:unnamed protein product [Digitaria exilis]
MSGAPRQRASGGQPPHRSKSRKRAEPIVRNADESLRGDACVLGGWLAVASLGDMEGRVHGGHPSSAISPITVPTDERRKLRTRPRFPPVEQDEDDDESLLVDACVHRQWLAAVSLGDSQGQEGRASAMSPFFTGSSVLSPSSDQPPRSRLKMPMSALAMEFCNIKIWRIDELRDHLGITGTSGSSNDASFKIYLSALSEDMSVRSDKLFSRTDFIDRKLLSILNDIADIMIEGGHEKMLRRAIDRQSAQLARFN